MKLTQDKDWILTALQEGKIELQGQFVYGSNYTFLVELAFDGVEMTAVYKPTRGERPLWDFPGKTLARREVAAYEVSEALGWGLVPPTTYRQEGPLGAGSLQQFIEHDPEYHYFNFSDADRQRLRPVMAFDLLINNADRKAGHILVDPNDHLWLIDHGVCFHVEYKLRTILWDFAGEPIPTDILAEIGRLVNRLENDMVFCSKLSEWISEEEIVAMTRRGRLLEEMKQFPHPDERYRPYPWPPI